MIYIFPPFFSCLFLCLLAYIRIIVTSAICLFLLCLWLVPTTPTVSAVWGLTGKFNSRPEHSYPVPGTWTQHTGLCGHYILLGLLRTGGRKGRLHNQRHGVAGNDRRSTWEGSVKMTTAWERRRQTTTRKTWTRRQTRISFLWLLSFGFHGTGSENQI